MHKVRSTSRLILSLFILGALLTIWSGSAVVASAKEDNLPQKHYLALGDSLAYGWQLGKVNAELQAGDFDPASFNTGYVNDFARMMARLRPDLIVTNFSCSGESSTTFLVGGCPWHGPQAGNQNLPLHNDWAPAMNQHDAAIAFLKANRGTVSPITLNLGGNDIGYLFFVICHQDVTCTQNGFPATLATYNANLDRILADLRAAAPDSEIIVLQLYDPFVASLPASVPLFAALNSSAATIASAHGARVADGSSAFTATTICTLTFACQAPLFDIHPNNAGYLVLARALWSASGYRAERN